MIFDCDGVLVDFEILAHDALAEMLTELGHPITIRQAVGTFAGRSLADVQATIETLTGRKVPDEMGQRYGARLFERLRSDLKPIPGVRDAIEALPFRRCVASSSSLERVRLSLEVTGLDALFGGNVFSATQVARGKPAPDLYLFAARTMNVAPGRCVVIEDSLPGLRAAVAAGMRAIGFTGGAHVGDGLASALREAGAARVISAMSELPGSDNGARGQIAAHGPTHAALGRLTL